MNRLYLASSIDKTAKSISKDIGKKNLKLAFITTASEAEKPPFDWLENDRKGLINAGFDLFDYTITNKKVKDFDNDLGDVDIVHVNGGNTFYLLLQSRKSGFDEWIIEMVEKGKIYTSSSAGSIIAGVKCPDYLLTKKELKTLDTKQGFNLVNFITVPHWGSSDFKDLYLDERLEIAYKDDQVPMILLTDNQYIKVVGDMYRIVDVRGEG